ncbi:MAG: trigger factor [Allobaculum sp.]|nr:trigger factor [Allobaculum sp.]
MNLKDVKMNREDAHTVTMTATLDGAEWKAAQNKAVKEGNKFLPSKGFRAGRIPAPVVRKMLGTKNFYDLAFDFCLEDVFEELMVDSDLNPVGKIDHTLDSVDDSAVTVTYKITVEPEVVLGEWKNLGLTPSEAVVTDEQVDEILQSLLEENAEFVLAEETQEAQEKDSVDLSYTIHVQGEVVDEGSLNDKGIDLTLDSIVPGVMENLLGMKANETKTYTTTLPADYSKADFANQEAEVQLTLGDLYKFTLPELNDAFIAEKVEIDGIDTVDQFRDLVHQRFLKEAKNEVYSDFVGSLFEKVKENVQEPVEIHPSRVDERIHDSLEQMVYQWIDPSNPQSMEVFNQLFKDQKAIQQYVENMASQLSEEDRLNYEDQLREEALAMAIAKASGVTLSKDIVDRLLQKAAYEVGQPVDRLRHNYRLVQDLKHTYLIQEGIKALLSENGWSDDVVEAVETSETEEEK